MISLREFDFNMNWLIEIDDLNFNETMHNLMLNHASSMIFQQNYLFRMIQYNMQAAYQDISSHEDLIVASHLMSRMMNSR